MGGPTDLGSRYSKSISDVGAPVITGDASVLKGVGRGQHKNHLTEQRSIFPLIRVLKPKKVGLPAQSNVGSGDSWPT